MAISTCPICGEKFDSAELTVAHINSEHSSLTNKTTVEQVTTTDETINTIETQAVLVDSSNGDLTIDRAIPTSNSTTKVTSASSISISDINTSTYKAISPNSVITDVKQVNQNSYPKVLSTPYSGGRYKYDYTIDVQGSILSAIQKVKENLNIPSAYNRLELNKLFHEKFNRFRIEYPDYFLNGTLGYVVMTRPDLNIFDDDKMAANGSGMIYSNLHEQMLNDPQMYYILNADLETAKCLTKGYSSYHHFNPLLSNTLTSLDISDETIDTMETGETFTGFSTQYAKSNIKSMSAGTINLKFPETFNMSITHSHQLWCGYESNVYRGTMMPKDEYIWNRELDYACDIYYFLLDKQDMIIRYWCKYTGCFPINVNKSVFSYDVGTELSHPELSVTYSYFAREDMSVMNLNEFNNNSGGIKTNFKYRPNYLPAINASGNTWSGPPFVECITQNTGMSRNATLYALRFRDS
jgi:hypothetical protein